jgi:hypothetical protein
MTVRSRWDRMTLPTNDLTPVALDKSVSRRAISRAIPQRRKLSSGSACRRASIYRPDNPSAGRDRRKGSRRSALTGICPSSLSDMNGNDFVFRSPPIRQASPADATWIADFLRERWNATVIGVHDESIDGRVKP